MKLLIGLIFFLSASSTESRAGDNWGRFEGDIVATFLADGRNMRIERPFAYFDPRGQSWEVPAGVVTDGASVPQFFWVAFPPFTGRYRAAAVVHDHFCQSKSRSWRETHLAFYNAMRASGVDEVTALAMYGAVYNFGPRWGIGTGRRGPGADRYRTNAEQEAFFRDLQAWIAREKPSTDEIARRLDAGDEVPKQKQ